MLLEQIQSPDAIADLFPLFKQVRPNLEFREFMELVQAAKIRDGYEVIAVKEDRELEAYAAMGMRVLYDLVHGKHLYIDELVVHEHHRSNTISEELLKYAEERAKELGCQTIRFSTGIETVNGKGFTESAGWHLRAKSFRKQLN